MNQEGHINNNENHRIQLLFLAVISTVILLICFVIFSPKISAEETPLGPDQPYMHGYNAEQLKDWSPENDPYAEYFRSHVPLANRIEPFQQTQANENLTSQAEVLSVSADYDKEQWFSAQREHDSFSRNNLKFWQYQDIYNSWHGLPEYGSPEGDDKKQGVVNIPNPAYTDAAHRNGVTSLGGWFWPRDIKFSELLEKDDDGHFIVADKMIEMADYFGFEGYFINQEEEISKEETDTLKEMLEYMREEGLYLNWYDSLDEEGDISYQNEFNEKNSPWIFDKQNGKRANDSIFLNYAFSPDGLEDSADHAKDLGLDPYKTVYSGIENDKYQFDRGLELDAIFHNDKERTPRTSLALFGTDMVWYRGPNPFDNEMQEHIENREQSYWSGPQGDPSNTGRKKGSEAESWPGVAEYIPAKSTIGSYPFVTRFNTGKGESFFLDGSVENDQEWSNMGSQDILPTWQWWTQENEDSNPLNVSYDYENAWNGGSSVKISGDLEEDEEKGVQLFKTELPVSKDTQLSLQYMLEGLKDNAEMQAKLIFKDDPENPVYKDLNAKSAKDWKSTDVDLSDEEGRTIAAVGLSYKGSQNQTTDFTAHLGELKLTDGDGNKPKKPTEFEIDKAYYDEDQASISFSWDFDEDEDDIWYYELYNVQHDQREPIDRTYDGVYYAKSVNIPDNEDQLDLELVTVSKDGQESTPATIKWDTEDGEKNDYPEDPFPVTDLNIVNMDNEDEEILDMEAGWKRYINVKAEPSYATNIHLNWESSDESVAEVDQRGAVTAKGAGEATITAQAGEIDGEPGKKIEVPVMVSESQNPPEDGVTLQAEDYDESAGSGLYAPDNYVNVRDLYFADSMVFNDVDFGSEGIVNQLTVRAAAIEPETTMTIRSGEVDGDLLSEVEISPEDDNDNPAPEYEEYTVKLNKPLTGKQDIHISFTNPNYESWDVRADGIVDVDWMNFQTEDVTTNHMLDTLENFEDDFSKEDYDALQRHLTALNHYENEGKEDKLIKHSKSFLSLLDQQNNNELIPKEAHDMLKKESETLIDRLDK